MTEKKNPNPFIRMAQEAKARDLKIAPEKAQQVQKAKAPKPSNTSADIIPRAPNTNFSRRA